MWLAFICIVAFVHSCNQEGEGESKQSKFVYGGRRFGHKARCLSFTGFICWTIEAVPRSPQRTERKRFSAFIVVQTREEEIQESRNPHFRRRVQKNNKHCMTVGTEHEIFLCLNLPFSNTLVSGFNDSTRRRIWKKIKENLELKSSRRKFFSSRPSKCDSFSGGKCYCCERRRRPRGAREQSTKWKILFVCSYESEGRVYWECHWWFLWIDKGLDCFYDLCQCTQSSVPQSTIWNCIKDRSHCTQGRDGDL